MTVNNDYSEEELLERFSAGDKAAFCVLARHYCDRLTQFVLWTAPQQSACAQDIVLEVFAKIFNRQMVFTGISSFKVCLYSAARHGALHWHGNYFLALPDSFSLRVDARREFSAIPVIEADSIPILSNLQDTGKLNAAVATLPENLKLVLLLKEWEDCSYGDISGILDIPVDAVRARLHNAKACLAMALNGVR